MLATRALQPIPQREIPPQSCKCKNAQVRVAYVVIKEVQISQLKDTIFFEN